MVTMTEPKVHMGLITGGEARDLYPTNPVVLIPVGSHEDQGPHAPMGDYLLAEKLAELIALDACKRGTRTVVAPVLAYGGDDFFGPMIGGIHLRRTTAVAVFEDMLTTLARNGMTRVIFINGHGGNAQPIQDVTRAWLKSTGRVVPSLYLWRIGYGLLTTLLGAEASKAVSGHGADPLTSITMHLFPDRVRHDMIPEGKPLKRETTFDLPFLQLGALSFEGHEVGVPFEYDAAYNHGVSKGDPRLCKPETGKILTDQITDVCSRFVVHFAARTP